MSEETEEKSSRKIKWTSEKVMSISALFVSAISLIALFYQLNLAREENELIRKQQSASVLPHLSQWFSDTKEEIRITFGNRGVGPAFIKKVHIILNDSIDFFNSDDAIKYIFKNGEGLDKVKVSTSTFKKGYVLPANQVIHIMRIGNIEGRQLFQQYMAKNSLEYEIIYEDVYGTRWSLSNKNDDNVPVLLTPEE